MTKKLLLAVLGGIIFYSCASDNKKSDATVKTNDIKIDTALISDTSWGPITKKTDIEGLKKFYGAGNVKDERICGPECADSIDVTIVFSNTNKEFTVYWNDSLYHKSISNIECYSAGAPYHTVSGFKIGTTLGELLQANGQKITFSGFDWDYGGYISSYNNGTLEKSNVHFRLDLNDTTAHPLLGDSEFHTGMPVVKKYLDKILVALVSLSFNE